MSPATIQNALEQALALHESGRLGEAEIIYRQVLAADPQNGEALHLLGVIAEQTGNHQQAADLIAKAIALIPGRKQFHNNLGEAYRQLGRIDEAIAQYRLALALDQDYPDALSNLGGALVMAGRAGEALAFCRGALALHPDFPEASFNLGSALQNLHRPADAVALLEKAVALRPEFAEAWSNLGNAWKELGQVENAIEAYRKAVEALRVKPVDDPRLAAAIHSNLIYTMHFSPRVDPSAIASEQRRWNQMRAEPLQSRIPGHVNDPSPERRLRIGYVSPDFRDHVVGRNLLPLLRHHDRTRFEIFCYTEVSTGDALTAEFKKHADRWLVTTQLTDDQVAEQIRRDRIDLLVDLTQHMAYNRLLVFARKPAPIQVSFAGYPGSTGLETIDYRITDPYLAPLSSADESSGEKVVRLPQAFWCFDPIEQEPPVNPLPALEAGYVTFGAFNNFCKVNEAVLALWSRVLHAVEKSRLHLLTVGGSHRTRILETLQSFGIGPERLSFAPPCPRPDYLALHHSIDLALDTFPYNGHTTTLDALWMGIPVVSLSQETEVSRAGLSILSNVGLPELVACTEEQFVGIATALARDSARLASLRTTLRARLEASPLMDAPRFARDIEAAYRAMWQRWCATGRPPREAPSRPLPAATAPDATAISQMLNAALEHHRAGRLTDAEPVYRQVIAAQPQNPDALHLLGLVAHQTGRFEEAYRLLREAVGLAPERPHFHNNLGETCRALGRLDEAIAHFQQALALRPAYPEAHSNLANVLVASAQHEAGRLHAEHALALRPEYPEAWHNLGKAFHGLGRLDKALASFEKAVALRPAYPEASNNLANTLKELGRPEEAIAHYGEALRAAPENPEIHFNLSLVLLGAGDFQRGWKEYEWRLRSTALGTVAPTFPQPRWAGEELLGQTIFISTEQGFGDILQMARYLPLVAARGGNVIVQAPRELQSILNNVAGVARCLPANEQPSDFAVHCPLMSLPLLFETSPETIPATVPYLRTPPDRRATWHDRARTNESDLKVGLVWAGQQIHTDDRWRSLTLATLAPVLAVDGVRFYSVQKGPAAAEAAAYPAITDWTADLADFGDTAALLECLDLLITVETSVAHLAGALARPVWTLMPFVAPWQWTVRGEKSLWYPTMRIFQQDRLGDWSSVVQSVAAALRDQVTAKDRAMIG